MERPHSIKESHGFYEAFGSFIRGETVQSGFSPSDGFFQNVSVGSITSGTIRKGRLRRTRGVTRLMRTGSGQSSGSCRANFVLGCRVHRVTTFFYSLPHGVWQQKVIHRQRLPL